MIEDDLDPEEEFEDEEGCPHCEETEGECEHLLAYFDSTFGECFDGYAFGRLREKDDVLNTVFLKLLGAGKGLEISWGYEEFEEAIARVWEDAVDEYKTNVEIDFGSEAIVIALLSDEASDELTVVRTESDGAPGMSAHFIRVYAENPEKEFDAAVSVLEEVLEDKVLEVLGPDPSYENHDK